MNKVTREPDFAKLGFCSTRLPRATTVKQPYVVYLRLPDGIRTFAMAADGTSLIKWGKDSVLAKSYGYKVIKPHTIRWRLWFWWRRTRRKFGI